MEEKYMCDECGCEIDADIINFMSVNEGMLNAPCYCELIKMILDLRKENELLKKGDFVD